jgi:hypothetical protein
MFNTSAIDQKSKVPLPPQAKSPARRPEGEKLEISIIVIRVRQHNCQRSVDTMTTLMAKAAEMAGVVLIQDLLYGGSRMKQEAVLTDEISAVVKEGPGRDMRGGGEVEVVSGGPEGQGDRETRFKRSQDMTVKELTDRAVREGRGPDLVGNGRSESVTITSSRYVQMDRQGLELSLELREAFAGQITVDCSTMTSSPLSHCLTLGQQLEYLKCTIGICWQWLNF